MKHTNFLAVSAALTMCFLVPAHGAPKLNTESPGTQAEANFEEINQWSAAISDAAFHLGDMAHRRMDPSSHLEGLDEMKQDINQIGQQLSALDAERDSLSAWQAKALDQILPLMHDAAENAEKAIQTFNSDRGHLWTTSYGEDTARIASDTDKVARLIRDYLKIERAQDRELELERDLGEATQF